MKIFCSVLFLSFVLIGFSGCKKERAELVTLNVSAYVDDNKTTANFAFIRPEQAGVFNDEGAVDRFFATKGLTAGIDVTDYSQKVLPGEYILIIQTKRFDLGVLFNTYTYNYITTKGAAKQTSYTMQFRSGRTMTYQPWEDRK